MSLVASIEQALTPVVIDAGFFLEEVTLTTAGNRRLVICIVDGEKSLNMDEVTLISREISNLLEEAPFMGETPFTLEVTSPGVDRPLTLPRHWRKNVTRLVRITQTNGEVVTGRITSSDENAVTLAIEGKVSKEVVVVFADVKKAIVEIEFNRKGDDA
jgi:ribosome maturation factor RimP